jgi:hypothetical protein
MITISGAFDLSAILASKDQPQFLPRKCHANDSIKNPFSQLHRLHHRASLGAWHYCLNPCSIYFGLLEWLQDSSLLHETEIYFPEAILLLLLF